MVPSAAIVPLTLVVRLAVWVPASTVAVSTSPYPRRLSMSVAVPRFVPSIYTDAPITGSSSPARAGGGRTGFVIFTDTFKVIVVDNSLSCGPLRNLTQMPWGKCIQ